tara:strand:+ start:1628 stop:2263 length:636 start_codon:yes stop_codon:yes gene_type:complete
MFKSENITSESQLEVNQSLSSYLNFTAQQNHYAYEAFYNLISSNNNISRILEIGTAIGGLTQYLSHICTELKLTVDIRTYEINDKPYTELKEAGIDTRIENIFDSHGGGLVNLEVADYINEEGTTLILCDGGDKIYEFNVLSEYLKVGDIIMAHDYAYDEDIFNDNINLKYWNWWEIGEKDVSECSKKYNLDSYMQPQFDKAVWLCKIKTK